MFFKFRLNIPSYFVAFVSFRICLDSVLHTKESQTTGLPDGKPAEGAVARRQQVGEGVDRGPK